MDVLDAILGIFFYRLDIISKLKVTKKGGK